MTGVQTCALPISAELVDSFIAVLITLVSVNYGYPIALQTLTILLNYLKNDNKVFTRFHPNKELMIQLNFDRYLSTKGGEGKRFILNFICFLLRYYEDLEYTDLSSDPNILPMIKRAEIDRTRMDIENIASHQETILKVNDQNQQITSNAFAELFSYGEDVRIEGDDPRKEEKKEKRAKD